MTVPFFRIHMLPARFGDALLAEWGTTRTRRMMVDGGPIEAYPELSRALVERLPAGDQRVELLVVTHVDTDHVEGVIRLLAMPEQKWPFALEEIWFNGWRHIEEARDLGGREGELMSALIHQRAGNRWNTSFHKKAVRIGALTDDRVTLADGLRLTLVSPSAPGLAALLEDWKKSAGRWDIEPGNLDQAWAQLVAQDKYHPAAELTLGPDDLTDKLRKLLRGGDDSTANGSSIAFLAEFREKSCLFLGDAHMNEVCQALAAQGHTKSKPLVVNAVKMAHHGSKNNITARFLELVDAEHWLVSTNGQKFGHPEPNAIEAVLQGARRKPHLWFNYDVKTTSRWAKSDRCVAHYPEKGTEGITVVL